LSSENEGAGSRDPKLGSEKQWVGIGATAPKALRDLAGSVRTLVDRMLRVVDADEELAAAKQRVDEVADTLTPYLRSGRTPRLGPRDERTDARPYYVDGVVIPDYHPHAIPAELSLDGDVTRGRVHFGVTFEGPPGCVHGGVVASFFDQILGHHNVTTGIPAMTGSLTVRYRRPTPLYTDLDFEVRVKDREGRKVVTVGTLLADGELIAEGEGLFILPRRHVFESELAGKEIG
jgi:acyl-coenzyme A thioesterase PaaI-like protein